VGGTKLAGALVAPDGSLLYERSEPTPPRDPDLAGTVALARALIAAAAERELSVVGLGIGMPEYVDRSGSLTSREVLDWSAQPVSLLADLGVPVTVESDVRCGALAEWRLGAGRSYDGLFYVSLGTGLSSTLVADGRLVAGARGEAIALGELSVPASVHPSWEGNLESFASGAALARRDGDFESAGKALGLVLADVVALLDPPVVAIGGGLGTAATPLWDALRDMYTGRTARRPFAPPIIQAELGPSAGLIGAGLAAFS
jgi:glucokinase